MKEGVEAGDLSAMWIELTFGHKILFGCIISRETHEPDAFTLSDGIVNDFTLVDMPEQRHVDKADTQQNDNH